MTDSLFDSRYRYDYIYPRGRSGETLRAVDIEDNDRPVVIKRPAPNDAPPIRAGQEVSIVNERKVLQQLAGHPVLTELLGNGQFVVGGVSHQYIVIERAEGQIVADMVHELAAQGERIPLLEMLVIIDALLGLLHTAHAHDIVYNDVDAKHLFWNRETYSLKVIDWGNTVFLEGEEVTPQGISRQSDIYQVGELLYFILTGGRRADPPRDAGESFQIDFGEDTEMIDPQLQHIVSRAIHPNPRLRYARIDDLRRDLMTYREPIERDRNATLGRINNRLSRELSRDELQNLLRMLEPALALDPGYPEARRVEHVIHDRLRDLEVAADLDAVRIYMESGKWERSIDLLSEIKSKAGSATTSLINLLLDFASLLLDPPFEAVRPVAGTAPPVVVEAIALIFDGQVLRAAEVLITQPAADEATYGMQMLLAERISAHAHDILLLRPSLYRLNVALTELASRGYSINEPRALLNEIDATLDTSQVEAINLSELRDRYRTAVDGLTALNTLLEAINTEHRLSNRELPFSALQRALNAAMHLADNMHVIGKQAISSPEEALEALDENRVVDSANSVSWDAVSDMLHELYDRLRSYQTYVPATDGSDLANWLRTTHDDLMPYTEHLFDELLHTMVNGLQVAAEGWDEFATTTIQGNRTGAVTALAKTIQAIETIAPALAGWLRQLQGIIDSTRYVERHAVFGGLGRALADGWEAFDRGNLADAERLGQQAYEIARAEPEIFAAQRLRTLAETTRSWVERGGVGNESMTRTALEAVEALYTEAENNIRDNFATQMPSNETYLKAMGKGLIELYARRSTAAVRILYVNYILNGAVDAHEDALEDAEFWLEAARKTLDSFAVRHVATRQLEDFIQRRHDIIAGMDLLNRIDSAGALSALEETQRQLESNPQAKVLAAAVTSLRQLAAAINEWADTEFRDAGDNLEEALNALEEVEQATHIKAPAYRGYLMELSAATAELHTRARTLRRIVDERPKDPDSTVYETLQHQADLTERLIGAEAAEKMRQWFVTYQDFLVIYLDEELRRSKKLEGFNERFREMFIDRHPAYPLFRHWYDVIETSPEYPPPPTDEPVPELREDEELPPEDESQTRRYIAHEAQTQGGRFSLTNIFVALIGIGLLVGLLIVGGVLDFGDNGVDIPVTISDTPTPDETATLLAQTAPAQAVTDAPPAATLDPNAVTPTLLPGVAVAVASDFVTATLLPDVNALQTNTPRPTVTPSATNTPSPTDTPSDTPTPSPTYTPSDTPTPTRTPTPTLPPGGLQGEQDFLARFREQPPGVLPWDAEQFDLGADDAFWRLGVGAETEGDVITIMPSVELMDMLFGEDAANRIIRVEATMTLATFNPDLLEQDEVFFGIYMVDADDLSNKAGLHIAVPQPGVINTNLRIDDELSFISQRAVNGIIVAVRLERNLTNGRIEVFINGARVGQAIGFTDQPDDPILPVLFVKDGGVIVNVTEWTVTLR